jgi:hypothetical protein
MSECRAFSQLRTTPLAFAGFPKVYSATGYEETRFRWSIPMRCQAALHSMTANNGESHEGADGYHISRPTG